MEKTLEHLQVLEKYAKLNYKNIDNVFENSINKLYKREIKKVTDLILNLQSQLLLFENQYNLKTVNFIIDYEKGLLEDNVDFTEWSSTYDMLNNAIQKLNLLQNK